MADKKSESKPVLEREYNVPLRKGWLKAPLYKRSKKAVKTLREFLQKHMKSEDIRLGAHLNEYVWKHGIKNPPHHVKLKAVKYDDGVVKAELEGKDFKGAVQAKAKEEKATGLKGKLQEVMGKKEEEEVKESPKTDEKKDEKPKAEEKPKTKAKPKTPAKKVEKKPTAKKITSKKTTAKK